MVVAPTAMAPGAEAGLCEQASPAELPADAMTGTPAATRLLTASFTACDTVPPTDMETMAGAGARSAACAATNARPARTAAVLPQPSQLKTRTACSVAHFATP